MGMYTHCRGLIEINGFDFSKQNFKDLMKKAENLSSRSSQCITCTTFNMGFNMVPYIFIGGEIKNYDNDWEIFLNFILKNIDYFDYKIETKYEEDENWRQFVELGNNALCVKGDKK